MKKILRGICSGVMANLILMTAISSPLDSMAEESVGNAELYNAEADEEYYRIAPIDPDIPTFSEYYDEYKDEIRPETEIVFGAKDLVYAENGEFSTGSYGADGDIRDNVLIWEIGTGDIAYEINVEESGIYCLGANYFPMESNSSHIELSMKIDGKTPYDTASRITLNRVWVNETDIYEDSRGNQVRPAQIQKGMWQSCTVGDVDGLFGEPLFFYLEEGKHEIEFSSERAQFAIESLRFFNPDELPDYSEYRAAFDNCGNASDIIRLEGENAAYKSDFTLSPNSDRSSYLTSPSDPVKVVYNTLGGANWEKALQSVTWSIPKEEIGGGGLYSIGIKARQNQMRGFYSNRRVYIDGEVPCRELDQVKFCYDTDWNIVSPKTESGETIFVYLDGGRDHTITLECVPGEIGESMRRLDGVVTELNGYYRKILMITGPAPDKYTDYYVHEKVPGLVDGLSEISRQLKEIQGDIESLSGYSGSEAAVLENMAVILDKCTDKPLKIPNYIKAMKDNIASLSAWMRDYRDQPLEIDYIELAPEGTEFSDCKENFFKSAEFGIKAFFGSFFEDYTTLSDVSGEDAIEVWIPLGRDQAQVINEMVENEFTPEYGIPISINLVSGGIMEATLAGEGPDAALFLGGEFPVNLAARDLLVDVSDTASFPDFGEVTRRFHENAMTHYEYNGGVYGLPISQTFPMMFYRTDILTELGYTSPPETWTELIDMLPALQRNYMSVGLILPPQDISPATEAGHTYAMLLLQKGGSYYNDDLTESVLDSAEAVQSFEEWTDFYTKYSFVQTYDAFSRFRTGEYPIVMADYTFYNQLTAASPEIKGLWELCQVPGTVREDGTISHAANSTGTGAVIFKKAENKENAWQFIKWFTEADTQAHYGAQIEGLLGTMGRFDTANVEALSRLSWSEGELKRLYDQQAELVEIPVLPSSYAVTRNIMNAFRETVNNMENPRDTLIWYNRDINEEIARKRENLEEDKEE